MTSCLVIQHVEPEPPHAIGRALHAAGVSVDLRRTFAGESLPAHLEGFAGLVVMGGPMSAQSDEGFPTRQQEIDLLAEGLARDLPTIGVCLGAQLLAESAGGRAVAGESGLEIGWSPVEFTREASDDPLFAGLPNALSFLHWHGDTFDLPPGGVLLASNARYRNQAFRVGSKSWGLQFHLEVDRVAVTTLLGAFATDVLLSHSSAEEILSDTDAALAPLEPYRAAVLGRFATLVAAEREVTEPA